MRKLTNHEIGKIGLHGAIAELTHRGIRVIMGPRGTTTLTIHDGDTRVPVHVHTRQFREDWILQATADTDRNGFYIFVSLADPGQRPAYQITPRYLVADRVRTDYEEWIKTHNPSDVRIWKGDESSIERWDRLTTHRKQVA